MHLPCHTIKIFEHVIDAHLWSIITISPNQCRFVKGNGAMDEIHDAWLLTERHREKRRTVFLATEKTFDQIPHKLICTISDCGPANAAPMDLALRRQCYAGLQDLEWNWVTGNQQKTHLYEFWQTKHLECGIQTDSMIIIDGTPLVKVSDFRYLRSRITTDGDFLAAWAWVDVA